MKLNRLFPLAAFLLFVCGPLLAQRPLSELGHPTEGGITFTDIVKYATFIAALSSGMLILYLQFFRKTPMIDAGRKWLYFISMFMLPSFIIFGGSYFALEEFKDVESCMSCHQMHVFGVDMMLNPQSNSLAAKHYRNKWINEYQCFSCHTGYGVTGTVQSKMDGLRHLYGHVTGDYHRPIRFRGEFPNANCLSCHIGGEKYEKIQLHRALHERILSDDMSCMRCHGNIHPSMQQRYHPIATFRGD